MSSDSTLHLANAISSACMSNVVMDHPQSSVSDHDNQMLLIRVDKEPENANKLPDDLRKAYLDIFRDQDTVHFDNPLWWKEQLLAVASNLKQTMIQNFEKKDGKDSVPSSSSPSSNAIKIESQQVSPSQSGQTFEIGFDAKLFQFSWDQPVITIGRASECDINQKNAIGFNSNDVRGFSRLHLLIFPLPQTGQLILVDVGSYSGFITKWRSRADRIKVCSRNFDRQNMLLESGESAVVWVGNFKLLLAPKGCVVCWSRVREIRFRECGHLVCCKNCIKVVHLCPICRAEIVKENYKNAAFLKSEDEECQTFLCLPSDK